MIGIRIGVIVCVLKKKFSKRSETDSLNIVMLKLGKDLNSIYSL